MFWKRSTAAIRQQWQSELDISLEVGQPPLIDLGYTNQMFNSLPGLEALPQLPALGSSVIKPPVAVGGNDSAWPLSLLFTFRGTKREELRQPTLPLFTGADEATHIASLATHAPPLRATWPATTAQRQTQLPVQIATLFAPGSQPDTLAHWEGLPLILMVPAVSGNAQEKEPFDSSLAGIVDWTAWVTFLISIALILTALIRYAI